MALTPQPTLEEMTADVLDAVGDGGNDVANPAQVAMVKSLIRRAQAQIQIKAEWTIARESTTVALPAGETTVDFPDNTEPGNILFISAQRASSPQFIWDLIAGISTDDRSLWLATGAQGAYSYSPTKYDFLNGVIEVGPACTQDITLTFQYGLGKAVLVADDDRPNCDGLAISMLAEIMYRNARGGDFRSAIPELRQQYDDHLDSLRAKQGTGQQFSPGSSWNVTDPARRGDGRTQRPWWLRNTRP